MAHQKVSGRARMRLAEDKCAEPVGASLVEWSMADVDDPMANERRPLSAAPVTTCVRTAPSSLSLAPRAAAAAVTVRMHGTNVSTNAGAGGGVRLRDPPWRLENKPESDKYL
jgi:hypothetical protein